MSEDTSRNQMTPNAPMVHQDSYEHEDLTPTGPFYFMAGLAVICIILYVIVFGMYRFLDDYTKTHQPALSPMATAETDTRMVTHSDIRTFPEPRLEENERTELRSYEDEEQQRLATYDWVDKDKGIVRIPIDRAMELTVQRGLPVRRGGTASAQNSSEVEKGNAK
jgi:hypothetical protein